MKKLSLLLVSIALFSFVSLNSCKQASQPAEEVTEEEVMEEAAPAEEMVADTAMEAEAPAEEVAE